MKRIARKLAVRAASRDVAFGIATGVALTCDRLITFVVFARNSPAPASWLGGALLAECVVYAVCTFGIYRRSEAAAAALAGLYVLRLAFVWYVSGRALPPISLITLIVGFGLYRGIRGTSELDALPSY